VEEAIADAYNDSNWGLLTLKAGLIKGAAVVVLDVKTGQVLALASYPSVNPDAWRLNTSFDVGTIAIYSRRRAMVNRATEETYPLGSVMKIASMAAAAGSGTFKLTDTVDCRGTYKSPDEVTTRTDWIYLETWRDQNYHGIISLKQALTSSCDVYFWTVGAQLNAKDATLIRQYANRLGLGVRTGIDALVEQVGAIPDPAWARARGGTWGIGDSLNIVIGQGDVQVTALQVARMMAAIANGKDLWKPYLVRGVGFPGQTPSYAAPQPQAEDIGLSKEVAQGIEESLCQVTTNKDIGTAQWVFWDWDETRIRVCGKTGTAQSGQANPHGWFAAYAGLPGQTPEIAVVGLTLYSREGSETSAPIVRRVIEAYYGLAYAPWPDFWSKPYEELPTPGLGEGGPPK
jgi:penicillin-binding protein 2